MKDCPIPLGLTLCLSLTIPALTQTPDIAEATSTATVANVYVQVAKGVNVYNATSAGKLTLVKGSPFAVSGQMEGHNGINKSDHNRQKEGGAHYETPSRRF
jgi:hypothetical protein